LLTGSARDRRAYDGEVIEEAYLEATINGEMRRIPLPPDRACLIGRSEKNTVVVDDDEASRNHAMLQADTGIEGRFDQSAAYIANWLTALRNDPGLVPQAAAHAQRACDLITSPQRQATAQPQQEREPAA